jgi:hypothetical protein
LHLGRDAGALDQLGQMTADLAARFSTRSARNSSPSTRKLTSVTICRELSDADQIIMLENGETDRRLKYPEA